jgi:NitT/TauT family transport system permease protein
MTIVQDNIKPLADPARPQGVAEPKRNMNDLLLGPLGVNAGRLILAAAFLSLWQLGANRLFDPFYFGTPLAIAGQLMQEVVSADFYQDLGVTAAEMAAGFGIGASAGIILGVLLARWEYVARVIDPFLLGLNSIPRIALAPMLIVWFGIDMASKIFLGATLVFFITFFNTIAGIRGVDQALCNVARVQGATDWQIFTKVMLPSASAWIMTGLKMSLPFALVGVIIGEFLVSSKGLGYRLNAYSTSYNTVGAISMIIVMMVLMMALTTALDRIEARLMRWRPPRTSGPAIRA